VTALALPTAPLRRTSGWARPKSDRWAEGDALVELDGKRYHMRGLVAKLRGIGIDFLYGYSITDTATIAGAGRNLVYGTCTSVTISATQTPPTVNTGGLIVTQT
jgi:hypothetical protein